jgi:glycosyltransferase involved in cell wall biosynthesis
MAAPRHGSALTVVFSAGFLGGSELFNLEYLRRAAEDGLSIHAIVPSHGSLADAIGELAAKVVVVDAPESIRGLSRFDRGTRLIPSRKRAKDAVSYLLRLRRALRTTCGPICCFGFRAQLAVGLQPLLRRRVGWVLHEIVPAGPCARLWRMAARRASAIWAYSSAAAGQKPLRGIPVQLCAVRLELGAFTSVPPPVWPPNTLGLVGDLFPLKNHLSLVEVVRKLRDRDIPANGLIVGRLSANSTAHKAYARLVKETVRRTGSHVRLTAASPAEIPGRLAEIDTLLHLTTVPETFGRVCVEAMAAARPVVAFGHGAVLDVVPHAADRSGSLCPPGDLDAVVRAVETLWSDRKLFENAGRAARAHAIENYGPGQARQTVGDAITRFASER